MVTPTPNRAAAEKCANCYPDKNTVCLRPCNCTCHMDPAPPAPVVPMGIFLKCNQCSAEDYYASDKAVGTTCFDCEKGTLTRSEPTTPVEDESCQHLNHIQALPQCQDCGVVLPAAALYARRSLLRESFEVVERLLQSGTDSLPRHEVERARLLLINIAPALINARSERAEVLEEAATVAEDRGAEYEKLGDYGVNQGYVRKVEAANEIAAAIRAVITPTEGHRHDYQPNELDGKSLWCECGDVKMITPTEGEK